MHTQQRMDRNSEGAIRPGLLTVAGQQMWTVLWGADPVVGVVPRGGGDGWVRFGRVRRPRGARGVGGIEVRVEGEGFVDLALQGSDAVVMGAGQGVFDGVGEQGMGADFDEGGVVLAGSGDGLAEADGVAQVGRPVVGVEHWCAAREVVGGADHRNGGLSRGQTGQRRTQFGQDRLDDRMMRGHIDVDAPRQPTHLLDDGDQGVDFFGRAGDHGLARRGVHRHSHLWVGGQQRLRPRCVQLQQRHRALPGQSRHQPRPGRDHPQPLGRCEGAGHDRRSHLPHRVPNHRVGFHPVGAP